MADRGSRGDTRALTVPARILKQATAARRTAGSLAQATAAVRSKALESLETRIRKSSASILRANSEDVADAERAGMTEAFVDRLRLDPARVSTIADGVAVVRRLADPVGEFLEKRELANGAVLRKITVPLGVVLVIFESRPNVLVDSAALCLKSGNVSLLKSGKESARTSGEVLGCIRGALADAGIPRQAVQLVDTKTHSEVHALLGLDALIDLVVPRGSPALIRDVVARSRIPVVRHEQGICHTFVDRAADLVMAAGICFNAKCNRPGTCNAMETLLVHREVARDFLPEMCRRYREAGVELRGDLEARRIVRMRAATISDWKTEYLDSIISIRVVRSLDEAIQHIREHGSAHTDAIVTTDQRAADRFLREVDSACVMVNASTRLHDGYEFGLGAEIGISTGKLHARGPMGLRELVSYKWQLLGSGQVRK